jgi:N-acetyl-anhydromuramyl-L-alanine amidase AmpD
VNIIYRTGTNCTTYLKNRPHTFIAIHYVASVTSKKGTALNVAAWFNNPQNRNGSADWIVDDVDTVCYNNDPNRYCWAVGDDSRKYSKGGKLYGISRNRNTISIEICNGSRSGKVESANSAENYFTDAAIQNALNLAAYLMRRYNIPIENVVRHYDVSGKFCPGVIGWNTNSGNDAEWRKFKERLKAMTESEDDDMTDEQVRKIVREMLDGKDTTPDDWAKAEMREAIDLGITDGTRPKGYATRQEAAIMVLRAFKGGAAKAVKEAALALVEKIKEVL